MPTLYEVKTQIKSLEGTNRLIDSKEINELPSILEDGETVKRLVKGSYEQRNGILVATNKRLIFIHKGVLFGFGTEDFTYDRLTAIQYKLDSTFGTINILTSDDRMDIQRIDKDQTIAFSKYVREKIARFGKTSSNTTSEKLNVSLTIADQIKKLADLRDAGLLTDEELLVHEQKILDV
jgi:hypothetical protein